MNSRSNLPQKDRLRHGCSVMAIMLGALPFLTSPSPAQTCDSPPPGLVDWWPGEGNANDSFGTNNGTLQGGLAFASGEVGQAFNFNGTSGYAVVPASPSLDVGQGPGITIECWIKPADALLRPVAEWNSGSSYGTVFWINEQEPFGTGTGSLYSTVVDTSGGGHSISSAAGLIVTNVFQHVALTYDRASGVANLYCNGTNVAQLFIGSFALQTSYPLYFGYRPWGVDAGTLFNGEMDEIGLYNRALSQAELQAIYNAGSAGKCGAAPVIASQPSGEAMMAGATASFSVNASGSQPLSYQWQENVTNIPASVNSTATNATLVLTNAQLNQSGNFYSVVVSNQFGSTNSSNALLTVLAPGACDPPPPGLVSWWPGELSAIDIVGTNKGTLVGGVTFTNGEVGQAFNFDGTSGYVRVPASTSLDVGQGPGLTIETWIQPADALSMRPLVEWNNGSGGYGVHFWINQPVPFGSGPGSLYANVVDASGSGHSFASAPGLIVTNAFQHVVLTYDRASGTASFYYNGALAAQQNIGSFALQTSYPLYFGYRPSGDAAGTLFTGKMDEVSLYNRALSPAEIQIIYAVGGAGKCQKPFIAAQPQSQVDYYGSSIVLSVNAGGTGTLSYQWLDNGAVIANATNSTLMLNSLQFTNAGAYSVVISNAYGVTTSAPAILTVNPPGVSIALYSGVTIDGVPGLTYGIQYSTDLSNTNGWVGLTNVTLVGTNALSFDLQPATLTRRYYRVVPGPISIP